MFFAFCGSNRLIVSSTQDKDLISESMYNNLFIAAEAVVAFLVVVLFLIGFVVRRVHPMYRSSIIFILALIIFIVNFIIGLMCLVRLLLFKTKFLYRASNEQHSLVNLSNLIDQFTISTTGTIVLPNITLVLECSQIQSVQYNYQDKLYKFNASDFQDFSTISQTGGIIKKQGSTDLIYSVYPNDIQTITTNDLTVVIKNGVLQCVIIQNYALIPLQEGLLLCTMTNLDTFVLQWNSFIKNLQTVANSQTATNVQQTLKRFNL